MLIILLIPKGAKQSQPLNILFSAQNILVALIVVSNFGTRLTTSGVGYEIHFIDLNVQLVFIVSTLERLKGNVTHDEI